jgi:thiamine-phosphate diphosphorylase
LAPSSLPRLHLVTDDSILSDSSFVARATTLLESLGPASALHLRARTLPARTLYYLATTLRPVAASTGAWLVMNDRLDIALAASLTAVQLPEHSFTPPEARALNPTWSIGQSIHAPTPDSNADWLVAGHIFATPSHADPARGLDFLRAVCAATTTPVIAIGGITPRDVPSLLHAGAHGVAVIHGIWGAGPVHEAYVAREYQREIERAARV